MFIRQPAYNWWTSKMGIFEIWDLKIHTKICKSHSWKWKKGIDSLEIEHKHLETDLKNYQTSQRYLDCKLKLDEIYSKKADGVRRTSKCDWYESGENSNKFILNLEKPRASQALIRTLVKNEKETNDPVEINTELQDFYKKLFTVWNSVTVFLLI